MTVLSRDCDPYAKLADYVSEDALALRLPLGHVLIRNDGSVLRPTEPEAAEAYKVNVRPIAREDWGDFRRLYVAVMGLASKLSGGQEPDWQKIENGAQLILEKMSDQRGYHSIYHGFEMIGDPGDPIWRAMGALSRKQLSLPPAEIAALLEGHLQPILAAEENEHPGRYSAQDTSENIFAAFTHDLFQKSDRFDVLILREGGNTRLLLVETVHQQGKEPETLYHEVKGGKLVPAQLPEGVEPHMLAPGFAGKDFTFSVERRSIRTAEELMEYMGASASCIRNANIFTRTTEHEAFFGRNRAGDTEKWIDQRLRGEATHPGEDTKKSKRYFPAFSEGKEGAEYVSVMNRAYRFCRRDVASFSARAAERGFAAPDRRTLEARQGSYNLGTPGVSDEEAIDADGLLLRHNGNRSLMHELLFHKGPFTLVERYFDGTKAEQWGVDRFRLAHDPRQTLEISSALEELDAHAAETLQLMQLMAASRMVTVMVLQQAINPHYRIGNDEEGVNSLKVFEGLPIVTLEAIPLAFPTAFTTLLSPVAESAVAELELHEAYVLPQKYNAEDKISGMNVVGLDKDGHPIYKGLPGSGDMLAAMVLQVLGPETVMQIAANARDYVNKSGFQKSEVAEVTSAGLNESSAARLNALVTELGSHMAGIKAAPGISAPGL